MNSYDVIFENLERLALDLKMLDGELKSIKVSMNIYNAIVGFWHSNEKSRMYLFFNHELSEKRRIFYKNILIEGEQ
jgi:hypothetical protein